MSSPPLPFELVERYNRPGPRYTSYPTAPVWRDDAGADLLRDALAEGNEQRRDLSLYLHLPFCSSLCLYCGCNVVISRDRSVAGPYLERLHREMGEMSGLVADGRVVRQLHWGGGTPTYISDEETVELMRRLRESFQITADAEIGIEVEPRTTSLERYALLRELGFNRVSMGVQDFDPLVQRTIRRVQPYEQTRAAFDRCRELGFASINLDLIYGLPHQSEESFRPTVERTIEMRPDRIALFGYAHVPWLKKQQKSYERHLPDAATRFGIVQMATSMLTDAGYRYIGLDHFVRPEDELARAQDDRTLHRNFQGYTTHAGCDLLGMGASAISGLESAYAQNARDIAGYYDAIDRRGLATVRGLWLDRDDRIRRDVIGRILCHRSLRKEEIEGAWEIVFDDYFRVELDELQALAGDGLVELTEREIAVTPIGRFFLRNIAMPFDAWLRRSSGGIRYSRTV